LRRRVDAPSLVIAASARRIGQHLIGSPKLAEPLCRRRVGRVRVGVKSVGLAAVSTHNVLTRSVGRDADDLVQIALLSHTLSPT
jgi:hypothetical protein